MPKIYCSSHIWVVHTEVDDLIVQGVKQCFLSGLQASHSFCPCSTFCICVFFGDALLMKRPIFCKIKILFFKLLSISFVIFAALKKLRKTDKCKYKQKQNAVICKS